MADSSKTKRDEHVCLLLTTKGLVSRGDVNAIKQPTQNVDTTHKELVFVCLGGEKHDK